MFPIITVKYTQIYYQVHCEELVYLEGTRSKIIIAVT